LALSKVICPLQYSYLPTRCPLLDSHFVIDSKRRADWTGIIPLCLYAFRAAAPLHGFVPYLPERPALGRCMSIDTYAIVDPYTVVYER
jgi:hypothetical protein